MTPDLQRAGECETLHNLQTSMPLRNDLSMTRAIEKTFGDYGTNLLGEALTMIDLACGAHCGQDGTIRALLLVSVM
jgi:hypothetical protein